MKWLWACECRGVGADKSAMGAINRPLWPVHVMRISGCREDKSRTLLYQVYQVYRAACEPAVFSSNRMSRVSGVSGVSSVSDKFEWKWLTVYGLPTSSPPEGQHIVALGRGESGRAVLAFL